MADNDECCEKVFHPNASPFKSLPWCEHFGSDFCYLWTVHVKDFRNTSLNRISSNAFPDNLNENEWKVVFCAGEKATGKECGATATFSLVSLARDPNCCVTVVDEMTEKHVKCKEGFPVADFEIPFNIDEHLDSIRYNDTLRILLRMWTVADKALKARGAALAETFERLLDDPVFADVALDVGTSQILAHRAILSVRSTVFRDQLLAASKNVPQGMVTLDMSDSSPDVVRVMLRYVYASQWKPDISTADALGTITLAHAYKLEVLKSAHERIVGGRLDKTNVVEVLEVALLQQCDKLKVAIINYLKREKVSLVGNAKIEELAKTHLKEVLGVLAGAPTLTTSSPLECRPLTLKETFMWLLCDATFSDVTISAGNSNFPAHKAVLSARSDVFRTMFLAPMSEAASNIVKIPDISPRVLRGFLEYIYTDSITIHVAESVSYLKLGDMYNLTGLKQQAEHVLANNINLENAVAAFECSLLFPTTVLKEKVTEFFAREKASLASHDAWEQLAKTHLKEVLELFSA